jgi:type II secretory pathway component PulF
VNTLAEACLSGARMLESQARSASARIAAMSQPLILFLICGLVGYLVLALFLPLIKLLNDLS